MKINSLLNERLVSKNKEVKFDYEKYWKAVNAICDDIKTKYDFSDNKIGIVGMARGALPLLVSVSHELNIRRVSSIQLQMSNSDNCHDYGKAKILNQAIYDEYEKYILFEDIIYKGQTTNAAVNFLKSKGKDVVEVYSLVIDEGFKNIKIENDNLKISYAYDLTEDDWVYFLWEKNLNAEE